MEHATKLAFLQNMTHMALDHAAKVPNAPTPQGGMSHDKMLDFVNKVSKMGLEHFATGGAAVNGPSSILAATPAANNTASGSLGGALSSAIGTQNGFQATAVPVTAGTNAGQLGAAYQNVANATQQQQNITNPLTQGLNQGAVNQSVLGNQLLAESQGAGPNPAQAQLNQNTGQNIAQQAALAAGQRGAGANAGLIASTNAQQGAATQQQAVGQAATLEAQQQLAAQNNLQNLSANQVSQGQSAVQGLSNAQQNEQNILQGANTATNNQLVTEQGNLNNVNASIATANQNAAGNAVSGLFGAFTGANIAGSLFAHGGMVKMDEGGNVLDANARKHIAPHNFALPGGRYPIHDINHARNALARVSQYGTPEEKAKVRAAVHKKYPGIGKSQNMAQGGYIKNEEKSRFKEGDLTAPPGVFGKISTDKINPFNHADMKKTPMAMAGGGLTGQTTSGPQSFVGQWLNSPQSNSTLSPIPTANIDVGSLHSWPGIGAPKAQNSPSPSAQNSPSPSSLSDSDVDNIGAQSEGLSTGASDLSSAGGAADTGGGLSGALAFAYKGGLMKSGGNVKASKNEKAVKKGDSLKNDKVPAMLSEGEIVIPRHISMGPNAPARAAQFVAQTLAKRGQR